MGDWETAYHECKQIDDIIERQSYVDQLEVEFEFPFENVYAAALYVISSSPFHVHFDRLRDGRLYRGQPKREYDYVPSLYREYVDDPDREIENLSSLVDFLRTEHGHSRDEAVAIAQHYSNEAGVETWLLDVTYDPLVALYFASDPDPDPDQLGTLAYFDTEGSVYEGRLTDSRPSVGELRLIEPDVPRIESQEAAFLEGGHPDLIQQYLGIELNRHDGIPFEALRWGETGWLPDDVRPYIESLSDHDPYAHRRVGMEYGKDTHSGMLLTFEQKEGVQFEDPDFGITESELLPDDDPYLDIIREWRSKQPEPPSVLAPPEGVDDELSADNYEQIAKLWVENKDASIDSLSAHNRDLVEKVCRFHSMLQEYDEVSLQGKSLRRFKNAVDGIVQGQMFHGDFPSLDYLVKYHYRPCLFSLEQQRIADELLEQIEGDYTR